jgi:hypothetical protein
MSDNGRRNGEGPGTGVIVRTKPKTKKPSMYKVLMLNDDYTPMEFVVHTLERFFAKSRQEATRIMLHVHPAGSRHLRGLYIRGRGDQGDAGDGFRPAEPTSAAVHVGKRLVTHHEEGSGRALTQSREISAPRLGARQRAAARIRDARTPALALTEDQDAIAVLRACSVDLDRLRREVLTYVDNEADQSGVQP